jgi:DNA-binding CsgD family transcriptional regulator/tetratricopeptide (TPR) repeat protein
VAEDIAEGAQALDRGDWEAARRSFEAALARGECPIARDGLGQALWWLGEAEASLEHRERAYAELARREDKIGAARIALWISHEYGAAYGNVPAIVGWLARAERLLEGAPPCVEHGWLLVARGFNMVADAAEAEGVAGRALALAIEHADRDLEVSALAQIGRARLWQGHTQDAFVRLDEAMAAATGGEVRDPRAIAMTCCVMISACERAMSVERAIQWCQVTDRFTRQKNLKPLFAFCRVTYAGVLVALGRWDEADRELAAALAAYDVTHPSMRVLALAKLAELRILQGRDGEVEEILRGREDDRLAARATIMLRLARGESEIAAALAERRIDTLRGNPLFGAPTLELAIQAFLACRDMARATEASTRLSAFAETSGLTILHASAAYYGAEVALAAGDPAGARERFERAVDAYRDLAMPLEEARARLGVARTLTDHGPEAAKVAARASLATFERLGAVRDVDAANAVLRPLGVGTAPGPRRTGLLSAREQEVLDLLPLGLSNAEIGARLFISAKTVEHHVGRILAKLDVKTRAAAAAYVGRSRNKSGSD